MPIADAGISRFHLLKVPLVHVSDRQVFVFSCTHVRARGCPVCVLGAKVPSLALWVTPAFVDMVMLVARRALRCLPRTQIQVCDGQVPGKSAFVGAFLFVVHDALNLPYRRMGLMGWDVPGAAVWGARSDAWC